MPIKKSWRVVGGTVAATVALGGTAALAQPGTATPQIDLDDVITIDQVTPATIAWLFDDSPTITLDESIASVADSVDSTETSDSVASDDDSPDSTDSPESPDSTDSPESEDSPESPDSPDSTDSPESEDSPESPDSPDSPDSADSVDDDS